MPPGFQPHAFGNASGTTAPTLRRNGQVRDRAVTTQSQHRMRETPVCVCDVCVRVCDVCVCVMCVCVPPLMQMANSRQTFSKK